MTGTATGSEAITMESYNQNAIRTAAKVSEYRRQRKASIDRTREQLFPSSDPTGLGVTLEYEKMGNQPVSEQLAERAEALGLEFEHLGVTLGTVIHNACLKGTPTPEFISVIRATLLERKVIFFRDQHLDEDEQVQFAQCFGELDAFPFGKPGKNPYILEIVHDEKSPGVENGFHTDVTWMEKPSLGSVAQLTTAPPQGGDTLFSDSHACYLGLPKNLQAEIEYINGIHDYRNFLGRGEHALPPQLVAEIKASIPFGVSHPLVRTHPETGKPALYLHGGFLRHDSLYDRRSGESLGSEQSQGIVSQLLSRHNRPEYICRFKWQAGSIAFWDNRAVQHYAASDYYPHRRVLRRVTVSGDRPYYEPAN